MREQRKRKALYVNRREELYPESLLQKEYGEKKETGRAVKAKRPKAPGKPGPAASGRRAR